MDFTDPTEADIEQLAMQVATVSKRAAALGLRPLSGCEADLPTIQAILDSGELMSEDTYELECLGVVLGCALVSTVDGLDWAIVHDEYGSDPTLRYRNSPLCITVVTVVSKRVEDGESVDVAELFHGLQELLQRAILEVGGSA